MDIYIDYTDKLEHSRLVKILEQITLLMIEKNIPELRFLTPLEYYSKRELKSFIGISDGMAISYTNNEPEEDYIEFSQCYIFELSDMLDSSITSFVETAGVKLERNYQLKDEFFRYAVADMSNKVFKKYNDLFDVIELLLSIIKYERY